MPYPQKGGTMGYAEKRNVDDILTEVCGFYGISTGELFSDIRMKSVANAKASVAYRLRMRGLSWPEVGKVLGRHHTTVMKAAKAFARDQGLAIV